MSAPCAAPVLVQTTTRYTQIGDCHGIAFAMQGGGAIGAFQDSVLEALHEPGVTIDACCASSIGAINASIYWGYAGARRVDRRRAFYQCVSVSGLTAYERR
jgi:predicted acylesterase/phospholipase RssA